MTLMESAGSSAMETAPAQLLRLKSVTAPSPERTAADGQWLRSRRLFINAELTSAAPLVSYQHGHSCSRQ